MALRTYSFCAAMTFILAGCGSDEASDSSQAYATGSLPTAESVQQESQVDYSAGAASQHSGTVARTMLGRELRPQESPEDAEPAHQFAPGEPIHMAVEIADAAPHTPVRIVWYGPDERVLVEDTKETASDARYLHFSVDENQDWTPGEYRAEVWVADEKVDEQRFAVVANQNSRGRSGS